MQIKSVVIMTKTSISIIFNITWLFSCLWMIAIMGISVAVIFKHSLVDSWHTGSTFWLLTKDLRFKPWFGPHKYSKSRSTHQRSSLDISADDIELFECADDED